MNYCSPDGFHGRGRVLCGLLVPRKYVRVLLNIGPCALEDHHVFYPKMDISKVQGRMPLASFHLTHKAVSGISKKNSNYAGEETFSGDRNT